MPVANSFDPASDAEHVLLQSCDALADCALVAVWWGLRCLEGKRHEADEPEKRYSLISNRVFWATDLHLVTLGQVKSVM